MVGIIHDIEKVIIHKNAKSNQTILVLGQNEQIDRWLVRM